MLQEKEKFLLTHTTRISQLYLVFHEVSNKSVLFLQLSQLLLAGVFSLVREINACYASLFGNASTTNQMKLMS